MLLIRVSLTISNNSLAVRLAWTDMIVLTDHFFCTLQQNTNCQPLSQGAVPDVGTLLRAEIDLHGVLVDDLQTLFAYTWDGQPNNTPLDWRICGMRMYSRHLSQCETQGTVITFQP